MVGTVQLLRARLFAVQNDPYVTLTARLCDPVIHLLLTSGTSSGSARRLCGRAGMVIRDGQELAQFLCEKNVALVDDGGTVRFSPPQFEAWLAAGM